METALLSPDISFVAEPIAAETAPVSETDPALASVPPQDIKSLGVISLGNGVCPHPNQCVWKGCNNDCR